NRYSLRLRSTVTQPKSIATVVVVFALIGLSSSTPTEAVVITASVVNGAISEIAATVVVLPTPNPPATMIFTGTGGREIWGLSSERTESMYHPHNRVDSGRVHVVDFQIAGGAQIADQDLGDAKMQPQARGDLRDRERLDAAHEDRPLLAG